jgi:hypothetical protein
MVLGLLDTFAMAGEEVEVVAVVVRIGVGGVEEEEVAVLKDVELLLFNPVLVGGLVEATIADGVGEVFVRADMVAMR